MKTLTLLQRIAIAVAALLVPAMSDASTITYYHNDLAGTPVAASNSSGQVIWRESYRPYGERLTNSASSTDNDVWFTSRRQDAETGLVYMGARYYDPVIGRFISTDPKQFDEQNPHLFNRYAYANNNPYKYRDPDGQLPILALVPAFMEAAPYLFTVAAAWGIYNSTQGTNKTPLTGKSDLSGMSGGGCDPSDCERARNQRSATTPTDRYKASLDRSHLDAARRELDGEVVARKADGTPYDHVTEVRNAQQGLQNRIESINKRLGHPGLEGAERGALQKELSEASRLLDHSREFVP
jgi:RHS repeat-associated protein